MAFFQYWRSLLDDAVQKDNGKLEEHQQGVVKEFFFFFIYLFVLIFFSEIKPSTPCTGQGKGKGFAQNGQRPCNGDSPKRIFLKKVHP